MSTDVRHFAMVVGASIVLGALLLGGAAVACVAIYVHSTRWQLHSSVIFDQWQGRAFHLDGTRIGPPAP